MPRHSHMDRAFEAVIAGANESATARAGHVTSPGSQVAALVGSKGTVFLTGGARLDHLKEGESVRMCETGILVDADLAAGIGELQAEHIAFCRLIDHYAGEGQCVEPCAPGECLACDRDALHNGWRFERPTYALREEATDA